MKIVLAVATGILGCHMSSSEGFAPQDEALLTALPKAKVSPADGIKQAEKSPGEAISAKVELEEGKRSPSVYTVGKSLAVDAEHNVLKELAGSPEGSAWHPETEVFKDMEHVSRASQRLTLVARCSFRHHQEGGKGAWGDGVFDHSDSQESKATLRGPGR